MDTAFRISWIIFALALTAAVIGYAAWNGGDLASANVYAGETQATPALRFFFLLPAFHLFSLLVAYGSVRARPHANAIQFRNVVIVGTALGMAIVHALIIANAFGAALNVPAAVGTVVGLVIMACGNYLPKCAREDGLGLSRPWNYLFSIPWNLPLSYLFGVRTWWTLASDHVWNRTHRMASRLWIAGGLVYALAGWFVSPVSYLNLISLAWLVMTFVPIVYSFALWRGDPSRAHA